MKRVSNYAIFVPLADSQGYVLVHGYTGALDLLDSELARQLLQWSGTRQKCPPSALEPDVLVYLEERGYLTGLTASEESEFVQNLAEEMHRHLMETAPHFYLMPTYDCQLRCTYCFERGIQNAAQQAGWLGKVMSPEAIDAAFEAIDQLNGNNRKNSIELYGGEPLLRGNRPCVESIVRRGRERGYVFLAATNGIDLDAYLDLLAPDQIACVQVPIDGIAATHNKSRHYPDGGSSFARIMHNVQQATKRSVNIKLRVNATREVLQHLAEFVDVLREYGLLDYHHFSCYFKAVYPSTRLTRNERHMRGYLSEEDVVRTISEYPELASVATGYPIPDSRVKALFESQTWKALSPIHCAAASNIYVFDPFGYIYPCNNVVGVQEHAIGRFLPIFGMDEWVSKRWHERSIQNMPKCLRCKYGLLCGGGCLYGALVDNNDLYAPHCDAFSKTLKSLILSYYRRDSCSMSR